MLFFKSVVPGTDPKMNVLLTLTEGDDYSAYEQLMFRKVRSSSMITETDPVTKTTSRIYLEIGLAAGPTPVYLPFYDDAVNDVHELPYRSRRAKFWQKKIELQISKNRSTAMLEYTL
jgi:hypothetical protein